MVREVAPSGRCCRRRTTTATVLAAAIVREGASRLLGMNPMDLKPV